MWIHIYSCVILTWFVQIRGCYWNQNPAIPDQNTNSAPQNKLSVAKGVPMEGIPRILGIVIVTWCPNQYKFPKGQSVRASVVYLFCLHDLQVLPSVVLKEPELVFVAL